ncbi:MAG TPA: tRNA epoxyqueuosine(34) reductase QueG [Acidimicrobiia bacterium]|nr:tRNA epoxyqueuosine(34) reductase QueG [Acidimicrobiia bacterium]
METLRERIIEAGRGAGLDLIGIAGAEPFTSVRLDLERRKQAGMANGLGFTYRDPAVATEPRASFPWARYLVVGARSYLPAAGSPVPQVGTGRVARVVVDDAYVPLRAALGEVASVLSGEGFAAEVLCDDSRLVDRAAAVRAGLGWWGKNTMVLSPGFGPWLLFGSVVTDADLEVDQPMSRDCGTCTACLPACPTGALVAPGVLDARLCLAAWAQAPGMIPEPLREAMGDRLYGCDDCSEACPPGRILLKRATATRGRVDLSWLLHAADGELLAAFGHWFIPSGDPDIIRRNGLIAAGNSGEGRLAAEVAPYTAHPNPMVAEHAWWALQRLGGPVAEALAQVSPDAPKGK